MLSELGGKLMYTVKTNKELENTKKDEWMNNSKAGIKYILEGMNSRLSNRYECISNLKNNIGNHQSEQ